MNYRSEIDGLRALAVIPVILFHAGFQAFSGGFVGVDVFFVISGYLITSIIISEKERGVFSISNFYERRARRILPALFLVMAVSIPFSYLWLVPADLKDFSESLFATSTFLSNFLFFSESGYFDTETELKPLLHTWSLAVEEQYYLFFPILLLSTWGLGRKKIISILAIIAILSLILAQWSSEIAPKAGFYLLPTRLWELLIGSFIAFYLINKNTIKGNQYLSLTGFLLILYAIFFFDEQTPFPSIYTLIPTIGAGLIILFTNRTTFLYTLLSNKIMVGIGLISYSAYLWHFPLIALSKYRSLNTLSLSNILILIVCTFGLAYLTWKYIETPTRCRKKFSRRRIVQLSIFGSITFMLLGYYGYQSNGIGNRGEFNKIYKIQNTKSKCQKNTGTNAKYNNLCVRGNSDEPTFAIIGDSHARRLFNQLQIKLIDKNISFISSSNPHCAPLIGFNLVDKSNQRRCASVRKEVFNQILNNKNINTVVLVAQWANYTKGYRDNERARRVSFNGEISTSISDNKRIFEKSLVNTIEKLSSKSKRIIIIHPTPEFPVKIQDYIAKVHHFKKDINVNNIIISIEEYKKRNIEVLTAFQKLLNVDFVKTSDLFCENNQCSGISQDGEILFSDTNHVTSSGAELIVEKLITKLSNND